MDVNALSGWCLSQTQGEEESIEGYLKAWDAIKDLDIGPSHVNLAAEIANRFMTGGHYANMVHFVNNLNETFMQKLKENEKFVRALIALRMTQRKYEEVFTLLQNGRFSKKEGLLEMWDEAHYREWEERMGKPLNALLRYRIRQRFLPPQHICPNGSRPTTRLPDQALKILKEWLMQHPKDPYPTKLDKELLMKTSGLSLSQVKTWFANARRRLRLKKEKGEEAILSEQEASSDSPEDPLSGEDGGPIKEEDGEKIYHKSEYEGQRLGDSGHGRSQGPYPYHHIPYGRFPVKPEPRVKPEPWSDFKQGMYPVSTSASHIQFVPVGRTSSTYIPCPPPHTSQYLKAMAGMCEEISPATYHLGAPRRTRSAVCSSLSELHPLHHPRSQACPVVQDESYPYLYEKHTQSEPSSTYQRTFYPDYPQRQSKWYPGHDSPHDQRMIRSYSVSAPPSLQNVNGHLPGQTSTVTTGHQGQGNETWSTYPRTAYREYPYVSCNPSCSRSSQAAFPQGGEGGHSSMTSIQRPVPSQTLPMMRHDQVSSSLPEQNTYLHWRPGGESQRGPLPAFHTSFDLHKLPLPMARSYQIPQGQGHDLIRLPNEHQSNHTMASLRRRHKSQPVITSSAPSYLPPSSNSTFTPVVFKQSLEKRSASFDCLEGSMKLSKTESPSTVVPVTSTQSLTNECPAHQRPLMIPTVQTTPPNAHVHEKSQSLSSPSVGPSHSTHPPANCSTTESREGMKEVALVLLDLSNKCPVGEPRERTLAQ